MNTTTLTTGVTSRGRMLPMSSSLTTRSMLDQTWRHSVEITTGSYVHNSIATAPAGFAPAKAGVAYGAAKQAAPPRGIPR